MTTPATNRVINFGAGPAALPLPVLLKAQSELLNFNGTGMSVLEMSHRSAAFEKTVVETATNDLRKLLSIPSNYKILFLQGGGTTQFAAVPLNLFHAAAKAQPKPAAAAAGAAGATDSKSGVSAAAATAPAPTPVAEYVVNGAWSEKAAQEAAKYLTVQVVANTKSSNYTHIPPQAEWKHYSPPATAAGAPAAAEYPTYLHYCANETVHGVEYPFVPTPANPKTLLVADHSSSFCSKPIDVSKYAVIYAGAQKNVGPAGATVVIVRDDLLKSHSALTPSAIQYGLQSDNQSMYNTPPCFTIYVMGLMFQWLLANGGLSAMEARNKAKAKLIYDAIDESKIYVCPVAKDVRSTMNVVFTIQTAEAGAADGKRKMNEALQKAFVAAALKNNMVGVEGHRSVGGMRVSLYNAITVEETAQLVALMKSFEADYWKSAK